MKVIKKALKEAVRLEIIPRDPSGSIGILSGDTEERGILTPAEIAELFRLEWKDERSKIASILGAVSGMRISEVVSLRIEYVNTDKNVILVERSCSYYEKRLKGTKNEKSQYIYTAASIINMLTGLYEKNSYQDSYIFYVFEPNKPMRYDTVEEHLERMPALLFGTEVRQTIDAEWRKLAQVIALKTGTEPDEMIAITPGNLDKDQKYRPELQLLLGAKKIEMEKFTEKRFTLACGEIARREQNVPFHSFRHFLNSTIRGTVSGDILRLQTGHSDAKMTDHYGHITDDRGEQLRQAVQSKILPFIEKP